MLPLTHTSLMSSTLPFDVIKAVNYEGIIAQTTKKPDRYEQQTHNSRLQYQNILQDY